VLLYKYYIEVISLFCINDLIIFLINCIFHQITWFSFVLFLSVSFLSVGNYICIKICFSWFIR